MKKFFKKVIYYLFTITIIIPFIICALAGFIAWSLYLLWENILDWTFV
jgi:hypothetical protein